MGILACSRTIMAQPLEYAVTARDVSAPALISAFAAHLKRQGKLVLPNNLDIQKTSKTKELAPVDPDFFYVRAASLARRCYMYNNQGVGHFATAYGKKLRRGTRTNVFGKAYRGLNRRALQSLAKIGIVKVDAKNGGRVLTSVGRRELDAVAYGVMHPDKAKKSKKKK